MQDREVQLKNRAERYKAMYERKKAECELFERRFIDYRNEMADLVLLLPPNDSVRERLIKFLEEKGDVTFHD